jgi:hypothetical protein
MENLFRVQLYRIHAKKVEEKLHLANCRVGRMRRIVRKSGQYAALKSMYSMDAHIYEGEQTECFLLFST